MIQEFMQGVSEGDAENLQEKKPPTLAEALREIKTTLKGLVMYCIIPDSFDNEDRELEEECVGCEFIGDCSLLNMLSAAETALAAHEAEEGKCPQCGRGIFYPFPHCPYCGSLTGKGE